MDKNLGKLLTFVFLLVLVGMSVGFYVIGGKINPIYLVPIFLLIQYGYTLPVFIKYYFTIEEKQQSIDIFLPILGEANLFEGKESIFLAFNGLFLLGASTLVLPFIGIPMRVTYILWIILVTYVLLCIVRGILYTSLINKVLDVYSALFMDDSSQLMNKSILIFSAFFPLFRNYALLILAPKMKRIAEYSEEDSAGTSFREV